MNNDKRLRKSGNAMRFLGWSLLIGLPVMLLAYPAGFLWGEHPDWPLFLSHHPPSAHDAFHPYLFMLASLYVALAILLLRGAGDPAGNKSLFDFTILSSVFHGSVMLVQAVMLDHEMAHMWADVPILFALAYVAWRWHPSRSS